MPVIQCEPTTFAEQADLFERYRRQITIPYDDFLEDHILASDVWAIVIDSIVAGFFGVKQQLLTIFFLEDRFVQLAGQIVGQIKQQSGVTEAFVPTTDLVALSILLEHQQTIAIQALHFSVSDRVVRPPEFGRECLRLATPADLAVIEQIAGDFLDQYPARIARNELYLLEQHGEILGMGVLVPNRMMERCIGTGMLTKASRRGQGVGRSIILHLKAIVQEQGMIPVPGCWYYNTNSRRTLESAGYISKSKLLRIGLVAS